MIKEVNPIKRSFNPLVISTWKHGIEANEAAMRILRNGLALDAVEIGARATELNPEVKTVGFGGHPDKNGHVTLDASIMDHFGNAGSVAYLEGVVHSVSVARKVMESTEHVMLAGLGAEKFALENGFEKKNLLTNNSKNEWLKWKKGQLKKNILNHEEDHDTISILAQDSNGNIAGASTTSGIAYKLNGRVGDSPIIGAGIYVDNDIGAAGATGKGEEVIKTVGSFLIVELMKQGYSPNDACKEAINRIIKKHSVKPDFQVAYIALRIDGNTGAAAIKNGFSFALYSGVNNSVYDVKGMA